MNKKFLYHLLLLPVLSHGTAAIWNGLLPDNASYTDTNINIIGDTFLGQGTTTVSANSTDVTIYVSAKSKVYSNDNSQSTLVLHTEFHKKITIIVAESLKFAGVSDELDTPVIIEETGSGTIEWIVQEDKKLTFGSGDNRGGTILKIVFSDDAMPEHIFKPRLHHEQIRFERHCRLGYQELNSSGPAVIHYAVIDALNNNNDHSTHIQFSDGAMVSYKRISPPPQP
ncbi:MAG TPA: hypothetical protein VL201_00215 [Patescibacteria group bacterium]|jgi:hypothetical protein|nr:hypothetical protein [Patescibacteria group bacterium]